MDNKSKQLILESIPRLQNIADTLNKYQVETVSLEKLIYFLTQFENSEQLVIVMKLLSSISFIDSQRMTYLLNTAYNKIDEGLKKSSFVCSLGGPADSSSVVYYQLIKQLFDSELEILQRIGSLDSLGEHIEKYDTTAVIFFDDNITSGTQLYDFFTELITGVSSPELCRKTLSTEQYSKLRNIPIRVCYAIQLSETSNAVVERIRNDFQIDLEIYTGRADYNNYLDFQSDLMSSEEEATFARSFIGNIAKHLYEDKAWSRDTVYSRLLGYGNLGKLTAFYYNVPKSLIPIFWKFGYINGKPWFPILPETQEMKKIIASGAERDFMTLDAIENWITSADANRKPLIDFFVLTDIGFSKEITLKIPSSEAIHEFLVERKLPPLRYVENEVNQYGSKVFIRATQQLQRTLSTRDYDEYRNAIDEYNKTVSEAYDAIEEYLLLHSSNVEIVFSVENKGNKPASNPLINIGFYTGNLLINQIEAIEKPEVTVMPPNINDFEKTSGRIFVQTIEPFKVHAILKNEKQIKPIIKDADYDYPIRLDRIGHNDSLRIELDIVLVNRALQSIELPYEITFDEDSRMIKGVILLHYQMIEYIDEKMAQTLSSIISNFNQDIKH